MRKLFPLFFLLILSVLFLNLQAQNTIDTLLPVRGFCIAAPKPNNLIPFIKFINEELASQNVNTLILRIDYNYQFESHPELSDSIALSEQDVKAIVAACNKNSINLIPQINLLGHQSWENKASNLLRIYPEFDETPHIKMPEIYKWPNEEGLYCKSYCPQHPQVHNIVFALLDEICEVFESDAFHAGMDEVFYIGDDHCPRCAGKDKAVLFAGEVIKIQQHLSRSNRTLWIWGDRLLDGKTTGLGMWEASMNNTHQAIDLIPKDVVICDWHYERPDQTAVYFAMKGFGVITCSWKTPEIAILQAKDMVNFRNRATDTMKNRFLGMMQTVWSDPEVFFEGYHANKKDDQGGENTPWQSYKTLYNYINYLNK